MFVLSASRRRGGLAGHAVGPQAARNRGLRRPGARRTRGRTRSEVVATAEAQRGERFLGGLQRILAGGQGSRLGREPPLRPTPGPGTRPKRVTGERVRRCIPVDTGEHRMRVRSFCAASETRAGKCFTPLPRAGARLAADPRNGEKRNRRSVDRNRAPQSTSTCAAGRRDRRRTRHGRHRHPDGWASAQLHSP